MDTSRRAKSEIRFKPDESGQEESVRARSSEGSHRGHADEVMDQITAFNKSEREREKQGAGGE